MAKKPTPTETIPVSDNTASGQRRGAAGNAAAPPPLVVGTDGAPPCNTAPANYPEGSCGTRILRSGVDSLYVTYQGAVREEVADHLDYLKSLAQSDDPNDQAQATYEVLDHRFEVRRSGSGKFPYVLVDNWFYIQVSRATTKHLPMARIHIASELLTLCGFDAALEEAYQVARVLGVVDFGIKIHRIDLCVDFVTDLNIHTLNRTQWVTRSRKYRQYWEGDVYSGITWGLGGDLAFRLYDKTEEILSSGKTYLHDLWRAEGWDGEKTVWRAEFEIKRNVLRDLKLFEEQDVLQNLDGLWQYCTQHWLRLTSPGQGLNQSRWQTHSLWEAIASVGWGTACLEPLSRVAMARVPSDERLYRQGLAPLTSYMAAKGLDDPHEAFKQLLASATAFYEAKGEDFGQYLFGKVRQKAQRYNVLTRPERIKAASRAYKKAKEG